MTTDILPASSAERVAWSDRPWLNLLAWAPIPLLLAAMVGLWTADMQGTRGA